MSEESQNLNLEFVAEGLRLVSEAEKRGIQLRILGSIAYRIQCPNNLHLFDAMARVLTDVDFAGLKSQNQAIREFLIGEGYTPDVGVYVAAEGASHIYLHPDTQLNLDVFADELYFCHRIPFVGRLDIDSPTISTTDLLLEKMQIVEINLKDFKDTLVLMLEHPLGSPAKGNKVIDNQGSIIRSRIQDLLGAIEATPKPIKWKIRAKVGTRTIWYQEVAEKSAQF